MYQALYRKYRPRTFEDVVGQEHITGTLKNQVRSGKPAHSYLLMGSRGTGKTTCARLIAKAVNCLNPQDGSPCGECEICRGIDSGSVLDVVEIDAASYNGVNDIRALREEAVFLPSQARYRVYIIDEVHMLSIDAVNALLKIMEEPPEHLIFILATTEVHKVPATIRSRCQRFDFKRISTSTIASRLAYVAGQEGIEADEDALNMVARLADGGMRDALSTFELCASHGGRVTMERVCEAAGLIGQDYLFDLADSAAAADLPSALEQLSVLNGQAVEFDRLCQQMLTHFRNLLVAATAKNPEDLIVCLPETLERYRTQAKKFRASQLLYAIRVLQDTAAEITKSLSRRTELEFAMAKLCDPRLSDSPEALAARIDKLEGALNRLIAEGVPVRESEPDEETGGQSRKTPLRKPVVPPPEEPSAPAEPMESWNDVLERLRTINPAVRGPLQGSKAYLSGRRVLIDCQDSVFREMMNTNPETKTALKQAIAEVTGRKYSIGPYLPGAGTQTKEEKQPLDEVLEKAQLNGIEVTTE